MKNLNTDISSQVQEHPHASLPTPLRRLIIWLTLMTVAVGTVESFQLLQTCLQALHQAESTGKALEEILRKTNELHIVTGIFAILHSGTICVLSNIWNFNVSNVLSADLFWV